MKSVTKINSFSVCIQTLGNHEFNHGIAGVVPFMEHLQSPFIVANIDDTDEPTFQEKYRRSIRIERNNRKIGTCR